MFQSVIVSALIIVWTEGKNSDIINQFYIFFILAVNNCANIRLDAWI